MSEISVLVIDDHPLFREGVRNVIEAEEGMRVVGEGTRGDEGIDLVRQHRPNVALIDVNLPTMNGIQVTRMITAERLGAYCVLLTAYDDEQQIFHAFSAGASAYCSKDIEAGKLLDVIRQVARGVETHRRPHLEGDVEAYAPLSPREMEILQYVTRGLSNKEIASRLGISHQTVKNHMTAILHKLDVEDRTQAAVYALRHGWVRLQDTRK